MAMINKDLLKTQKLGPKKLLTNKSLILQIKIDKKNKFNFREIINKLFTFSFGKYLIHERFS